MFVCLAVLVCLGVVSAFQCSAIQCIGKQRNFAVTATSKTLKFALPKARSECLLLVTAAAAAAAVRICRKFGGKCFAHYYLRRLALRNAKKSLSLGKRNAQCKVKQSDERANRTNKKHSLDSKQRRKNRALRANANSALPRAIFTIARSWRSLSNFARVCVAYLSSSLCSRNQSCCFPLPQKNCISNILKTNHFQTLKKSGNCDIG